MLVFLWILFRDLKTAKQRQHRDAVLSASNRDTVSNKKGKPGASIVVTRVDIEEVSITGISVKGSPTGQPI